MSKQRLVLPALAIATGLVLTSCGAHLTSGLDLTNAPVPEPTPPPCSVADVAGCKAGAAITLRGVNFDIGKATLTAEAREILGAVATTLNARTGVRVEIAGHTDSAGAEGMNQELSERRAQAVVSYLIGAGISSGRLHAKGYGESMPIAGNDTAEGRELNRRVEMKVLGSGTSFAIPAHAPAVVADAPASMPLSAGSAVTISDHTFAPASLAVIAGTTVTWTNHDDANHTIKLVNQESGVLAKGDSYSHTFSEPGQYDYQCGYHSYMKGTIRVSG